MTFTDNLEQIILSKIKLDSNSVIIMNRDCIGYTLGKTNDQKNSDFDMEDDQPPQEVHSPLDNLQINLLTTNKL